MSVWINHFCYDVFKNGTARIVDYDTACQDKTILVPFEVEHDGEVYQVTCISESAFQNVQCDEIILPNTIVDICEHAFFNSGVHSVQCGGSKTPLNIHYAAFVDCRSLVQIQWNRPVVLWGEDVFANCVNLQNIDTHNFIKWIPAGSFKNCMSLKDFVFSDGLNVEDYAFENVTLKNARIGTIGLGWDFFDAVKTAAIQCKSNSPFVDLAYEGLNIRIIQA